MASIATLTIDLIGRSGKLTAELKKANKNTKSWADKTRKMVTTSAKALGGFGVAGVTAFTAIYAKTAQFIDQQAKTADRLGVTTEALSGLQHAAEQTGASTESLNMGLQRMTRRIGQVAATGKGEAKVALDQLGISIDEIKSKSPDQQFALIADKMKDVHDQGQKVFLTQKLFDSEGVKLLNTLNLGADGIKSMMDEAEVLGFAINRIDAAKIEKANDNLDRARKTTRSFSQAMAVEAAPIIGALSDMWTDSAKEAGGFGQVAQQVVSKVGNGIGFLSDMGRGLQVTFLLIRQAVAEVANGVVQMNNAILQTGAGFLEYIGFDTSGAKEMQSFADSFSATTDLLAKELEDLVAAPMPSEKIKAWVSDAQIKFQEAAKEQTNNKVSLESLLLDDSDSNNEETDKKAQSLVDKVRNQYQQIYDTQLLAEGNEIELENRRYNRLVEQMEKEFELLREKNLITAEIEAEHRTAKEQLELQHQSKLADIEKERQQVMINGYGELLNVMGSYFDGMEGKQAGYARAAITLGQTLLDEEKRNSIVSIWSKTYETAMKAYNSLAGIPFFGPALGAAAAGVVIGAGTAYAAKVSGIASFDGGGYTGDGPRIGGVDGKGGMYAIVHPQETIIDHTKGQKLAQQTTQNVSVNYHFGGDASENERMLNNNRNATIRDARRLTEELGRPY